jgi:hypothetical protein
VRGNITERNWRNGIYAACLAQSGTPLGCASENVFASSTMRGNGTLAGLDARDDSSPPPPLDNTWTGNTASPTTKAA